MSVENHERILDARADFLIGKEHVVYSQFGEDGYIAATLLRIGVKNNWCFEVGACDGIYCSNTKALRDVGWNAVLIEGLAKKYLELEELCSGNANIRTIHKHIGYSDLDTILEAVGAPKDLDLGVIDIDGQDYWAWHGMKTYRPRLMLVEYSPYTNDSDYLVPLGEEKGQSAINPIIALGKEKGYFPLVSTFCNVLFCREDEWK